MRVGSHKRPASVKVGTVPRTVFVPLLPFISKGVTRTFSCVRRVVVPVQRVLVTVEVRTQG